jgi:hypothetical protein
LGREESRFLWDDQIQIPRRSATSAAGADSGSDSEVETSMLRSVTGICPLAMSRLINLGLRISGSGGLALSPRGRCGHPASGPLSEGPLSEGPRFVSERTQTR